MWPVVFERFIEIKFDYIDNRDIKKLETHIFEKKR